MMASKAQGAKTTRTGNPGLLLIRSQRDHLKELNALIRNHAEEEKLVHQARTAIKRLRAGWRLLRPDIPESVFLGENQRLRKTARELTAVREKAVLAKTLEKLAEQACGEGESRLLSIAFNTFLARRLPDGKEMKKSGTGKDESGSGKPWLAALQVLSESRRRMEALDLSQWGWNRVRKNLAESYRKMRKGYRDADPDRDDSFHEWRTRTKDLWYQIDALFPDLPAANKIVKRLEALQDMLGDAHDLTLMGDRISRSPDDFGVAANLAVLRKLVVAKNRKLKGKSLRLGRKILGAKPEKFLRKLELPE